MTRLEELYSIHQNYYTYNEAEVTNALRHDTITVSCPRHGGFSTTLHNHLNGRGCRKCADEVRGNSKNITAREKFFERAGEKFGNRYTYGEFINTRTKMEITCPEHGSYLQKPWQHLNSVGCPTCGKNQANKNRRMTTDEFIGRAKTVHGNRYNYSQVTLDEKQLRNCRVTIGCPDHGEFTQMATDHISGHGCQECAREKISDAAKKTFDDFVRDARERFGDTFLYEETDDPAAVLVIHPEHGSQLQKKSAHLHRYKLGFRGITEYPLGRTTEEFVAEARVVHGDMYTYDRTVFSGTKKPVTITCQKHGDFTQLAENHIRLGTGCPSCRSPVSVAHQSVIDMLPEDVEYVVNDRSLISPLEIDIYIPAHNLGIEVNGLWFHSAKYRERGYHEDKYQRCVSADIRLLQFWDLDVVERPELVRSMIRNALGLSQKLAARKTAIRELTTEEYRGFLEDNHIQGKVNSAIKLGLIYDGEIVSVMGASHIRGEVNLQRFCNRKGITVVGGFSKLLSRLPLPIVSFSDSFYSSGDVYAKNGFTPETTNPPRLHYTDGASLVNRRQFQKPVLKRKYPELDFTKTEKELASSLGFEQVFGGATTRWVYSG